MWAAIAQSVWLLATDWRVLNRIRVGSRFSAAVQTGPGAHPASSTMGTGSFPGDKAAEVKEKVELYNYSPSGPSLPVLG
jgi:hypothetical protein